MRPPRSATFVPGGTVTAANSCGINDGAAIVAVASESWRVARSRPGLRILGWEIAGVDPNRCGLGVVPAVRRLLERAGLALADVGVVEITEAFAGQVLACLDALGLDRDRVCPDGGAIALGHPWAASGAVLVVRLFARMVRQDGPRYGLAACAVGGHGRGDPSTRLLSTRYRRRPTTPRPGSAQEAGRARLRARTRADR